MNEKVISNYSKLKPSLFFLPVVLLSAIVLFLYTQDSLSADKYVQIQKKVFFFINYNLGQFPNILYNVTQLGDASIALSLLSIFIVYAPKMWEALISASLISLIFSSVLKNIFSVPRPAVVFDNSTFTIIGNTAVGHASLPSGHSITVFTILTILMFAFMPKKVDVKILWFFLTVVIGLMIAFTRVGVGAHYPLDVITGSIIGYISALIGIFINRKFPVWTWINNKKFYPVFIVLILISCISLISRIIDEGLVIYYFTLISLIVPLYKITYAVVKK